MKCTHLWRKYTLPFRQCQHQPIPFSSTEFRQNAGGFCCYARVNCNRNQSVTGDSEPLIADSQDSYGYAPDSRGEGFSWFSSYTGISIHWTKSSCQHTFGPCSVGGTRDNVDFRFWILDCWKRPSHRGGLFYVYLAGDTCRMESVRDPLRRVLSRHFVADKLSTN